MLFVGASLAGGMALGMSAPSVAQSSAALHPVDGSRGWVGTPAQSTQLHNGVLVEQFEPGAGERLRITDKVRVHYLGRFPDGTVFDSSYARGEPAVFELDKVIACWTHGLQQLAPGARARLGCPAHTAYGVEGVPGVIPPDAILFFDIEVLGKS